MNISSLFASSIAAKAATAIGKTFASAAASGTSAAGATTQASPSPDVVVSLSSKAMELLRARQVSEETTAKFKDILARAETANAQQDPKAFLSSLPATDMEVLRQVHSLADPINVSALNNEGAANLLVQPGSAQDLDNNGLTAIGAANIITFPPQNAPESFKAAWNSATEGMSFADIPTQMIFAVGLANMRYDASTGRTTSIEPGDPNWRNPYADPNYDYRDAVGKVISGLEFQYAQKMISQTQYEHDMNFYSRLSQALT